MKRPPKPPAKRGRPPQPNSAAGIGRALELVRAGQSYAAAAKATGLDRTTVGKAAKAAGLLSDQAHRKPKGQAAAPPAPLPVEPPAEGDDADVSLDAEIKRLSSLIRQTRQRADQAHADGNAAAASKYTRDIKDLTNLLIRTQSDVRKAAGDGIVFTAQELKDAAKQVVELIDALAASPEGSVGVCPRCGEHIRMARASDDKGSQT